MLLLWLQLLRVSPTLSQTFEYSSNGNYMMLHGKVVKQADAARSDCLSEGTDLASIHSDEQQTEAENLCWSIFNDSFPGEYGCTIGLNDKSNERVTERTGWTWFDNSTYSYENWRDNNPRQPDSYQGTQEDCVGIILKYFGAWADFSCTAETTLQMGFICNTPPTNAPTSAPTSSTSNPSSTPSESPTSSTNNPSQTPSQFPSMMPTFTPTRTPTTDPTFEPTYEPTIQPTSNPTVEPTSNPTLHPTSVPTQEPTYNPTVSPTKTPSRIPSTGPTISPSSSPAREAIVDEDISSTVELDSQDQKGKGGEPAGTLPTYVIAIFSVLCVVVCVALGLWMASCIGSKDKSNGSEVEMNASDNQNADNIEHSNSEALYGAGETSGDKNQVEIDVKRQLSGSEAIYGPGDTAGNEPVDLAEGGRRKISGMDQNDAMNDEPQDTAGKGEEMIELSPQPEGEAQADHTKVLSAAELEVVGGNQDEQVLMDDILSDVLEMQQANPNKIHEMNRNDAHKIQKSGDSNDSDNMYHKK